MLLTRLALLAALVPNGAHLAAAHPHITILRRDAGSPSAVPVIGQHGVLYITGAAQVFQLTPPASPGGAWKKSPIYNFASSQGAGYEKAPVTIGAHGELYGTTTYGGYPCDCGLVFMLTPPSIPGNLWTETTLYTFTGTPDGSVPSSGLVIGPGGALYGTTSGGGTSDNGAVFQLTPPSLSGGNWTETVIHSFAGLPDDGSGPYGGLTIGSDGTLYGTTGYGGQSHCNGGCGAAFSLSPPAALGGAWSETLLHNFAYFRDGSFPSGLLPGPNGEFYGTTAVGGTTKVGTIFQLTPPTAAGAPWTKTTLFNFTSPTGELPTGPLALYNGTLYGTTNRGA